MKILLIHPGQKNDLDSKIIREIPYLFSEAFFAPHSIASVAALTPNSHSVKLHDELIHGPAIDEINRNSYDIVGFSITTNQLNRCLEIAAYCKEKSPKTTIVAGGIGVEYLVHDTENVIDVIFHGETEETWPEFISDFENKNFKTKYKNISKPDMTKAPAPKWELLGENILKYNAISVQTTRGCPFDCNFCDVIYTYGRIPRTKTITQVMNEIKKLQEIGIKMIFFADDNFSGNKRYTKELLRELIPFNNSLDNPIGFLTQLDITISKDEELLELLADSNFYCG